MTDPIWHHQFLTITNERLFMLVKSRITHLLLKYLNPDSSMNFQKLIFRQRFGFFEQSINWAKGAELFIGTRGRHNWIGFLVLSRSNFLARLPIRSNFFGAYRFDFDRIQLLNPTIWTKTYVNLKNNTAIGVTIPSVSLNAYRSQNLITGLPNDTTYRAINFVW